MKIKLVLGYKIPSLNRLKWRHWREQMKDKAEARNALASSLRASVAACSINPTSGEESNPSKTALLNQALSRTMEKILQKSTLRKSASRIFTSKERKLK